MDGVSLETKLPESWSPKGENLLWSSEEFATRATPVVMNGKVYVISRAFPESEQEGEKIACLNASTGELIWEEIYNIFLSDAPAERIGWSSVVADPQSNRVYSLGLGAMFKCMDADTGKVYWERSMIEEFGMLSTYGGRTNYPTIFDDLVIISGVTTGWGETSIPAHRFIAMDKLTGEVVWQKSTRLRPEDTTYSAPVLTMFDGVAAMVVGAGDGRIYALQPRTGKTIWEYHASNRGVNTTPLVHDGIVYCGHSEQDSADTTKLGAIFAFDGRTTGEIKESDLLWKHPAMTVGRSSPLMVDGRLYMIEDGANMLTLDPKSGEILGQKKLGRIMFGSPIVADGKIYVGEQTGRIYILKPTATGFDIVHQTRLSSGEEVFGSMVASGGRVYVPSTGALYCFGSPDANATLSGEWDLPTEQPVATDSAVTQILLVPGESVMSTGQKHAYQVRGFNDKGQFVRLIPSAELSVEGMGATRALEFTTPDEAKPGVATLTAKVGELTAQARVRIIPPLPWRFDFNDAQVPPTWVGANYRHRPANLEGEPVLVKVSTIPKGTRSQAFMGPTDMQGYTIQADFFPLKTRDSLPDFGLVNQRYTLDLQSTQELQIRSWVSRLELRFAKTIAFNWQPERWYTMKFQGEPQSDRMVLRGKVWPRDEKEPADWQIEAADLTPNRSGSPGLFGNATNSEFYIDNVVVTEN